MKHEVRLTLDFLTRAPCLPTSLQLFDALPSMAASRTSWVEKSSDTDLSEFFPPYLFSSKIKVQSCINHVTTYRILK